MKKAKSKSKSAAPLQRGLPPSRGEKEPFEKRGFGGSDDDEEDDDEEGRSSGGGVPAGKIKIVYPATSTKPEVTKWLPVACASGEAGPRRIRAIFRLGRNEEIMLTFEEGGQRKIVMVDDEWTKDPEATKHEFLKPEITYTFVLPPVAAEDAAKSKSKSEAGRGLEEYDEEEPDMEECVEEEEEIDMKRGGGKFGGGDDYEGGRI
jgi:hypothetical protein